VTTAEQTQTHQVGTVARPQADTLAWSPVADTLAMVTAAGVALISPGVPSSRPLDGTEGASSLAWSPDGRSLAVMIAQPQSRRLAVVSLAGGQRTLMETSGDDILKLAEWWPDGRGLLAWRDPQGSVSGIADGTDLLSITLSGNEGRLTTMLPYRQWLSWSPDRRHLVVVEGRGREAFTGKHLAVCDIVDTTCRAIPTPPGTVALDPAWSPNGGGITYVGAIDDPAATFGTWAETRRLWAIMPDGSGGGGEQPSEGGADWPTWSPDGRAFLAIVHENSVWLVTGKPSGVVAERLYQTEFPPGYSDGFVDWSQTIAWHPG